VQVAARTASTPVRDGLASFSGARPQAPWKLGPDGVEIGALPAGRWSVLVVSPEYGLQQRSFTVPEDSRSLIPVDVLFQPPEGGHAGLAVEVTDPEGRPVSGAEVRLDGTRMGSTTNDGTLELSNLHSGARELEVAAPLRRARQMAVTLRDGTEVVDVVLDWAPGATRLVTRGPDGPVTDAILRLVGPAPVPAMPVNAAGERLLELAPGRWQVLVVSPGFGLAQREVVVRADELGLRTVSIDLRPVAARDSELLVRVLDRDGQPVSHARVRVETEPAAVPCSGGARLISGLKPGKVGFEVTAPGFAPARVADLTLLQGAQERSVRLEWLPRSVVVTVRDAKGSAVDAEVRFDGPDLESPRRIGADGVERFQLRPGTWQILASTAELGSVRREVTLAPTSDPVSVEFRLVPARIDVSSEQLVIRERVLFDFNSVVLRPEAAPILDEVAATLLGRPEFAQVEVQGHSDNVGRIDVNLDLSEARAQTVLAALIDRGVAPERLTARGYGATRPVASNATDDGRARNRRVAFEIASLAEE
jgi:outer membrane protein OmpA-like peptidoglycan-associated protein